MAGEEDFFVKFTCKKLKFYGIAPFTFVGTCNKWKWSEKRNSTVKLKLQGILRAPSSNPLRKWIFKNFFCLSRFLWMSPPLQKRRYVPVLSVNFSFYFILIESLCIYSPKRCVWISIYSLKYHNKTCLAHRIQCKIQGPI